MQQAKKRYGECPNCGGPIKRNRGAISKKWYRICADKGENCFRQYEKERGN